jgi:hypothetical protein
MVETCTLQNNIIWGKKLEEYDKNLNFRCSEKQYGQIIPLDVHLFANA